MTARTKLTKKLTEHSYREKAVGGRGLGQLPTHLLDKSPWRSEEEMFWNRLPATDSRTEGRRELSVN